MTPMKATRRSRPRPGTLQRVLGVAVVVLVVAMMVLPMVSPSSTAAADDDAGTIQLNGQVNLIDDIIDPSPAAETPTDSTGDTDQTEQADEPPDAPQTPVDGDTGEPE